MRRLLFALAVFAGTSAFAQQSPDLSKSLDAHDRGVDRAFEDTQRFIDDALWYFKLGDVANIQKYRIASSKPRREKNATSISAGNMLEIGRASCRERV